MLDDFFASIALESREKIATRNIAIIRDNLAILDEWISKEPRITYVKPKAGTTAFLKYDFDIPSRDFCVELLKKTGVLFAPGSAMEMEGWVRIGYANDPKILIKGLQKVSEYLPNFEQR